MPKNNGYKICYKEHGDNLYRRYFITFTHKQAKGMVGYYRRYPQRSREDRHELKEPKWLILPITNKEIKAGIWEENPFPTSSFSLLWQLPYHGIGFPGKGKNTT